MFNFKGKVDLITGASYGLGEQFAYSFAEAGADLIVVGNAIEKDPSLILDISQGIQSI